ncbi:MAG: bifunctional phosphopantothenoylcysteine decarboxylase/phosphopantothenate--cysteine ligase CoaBC [Gemmataceae bacterium]|nr:bifunctional phosphopantothenoylcysteine decarboxylase/phosphopantothenate--cysteine ligase CoaBC [Gemmataceae bacterium]
MRLLQQEGCSVQVVMTAHAQEFIRPLTFAALSGQKVITDMFDRQGAAANLESAVEHIDVASSADLLLIAPATANVVAKLAHGVADDFLTTAYLATTAPVVVAPAMNVNMWQHAVVQENVARLRERGVAVVEPDEGYLACGWTGPGRLASNEAILARVREALGLRPDLKGETVLVTAGPTCEDLDPVRYLSNRSSGRMGYALAEAATRRGARVVLVSGPTALVAPAVAEFESVRSAEEMRQAIQKHLGEASVVIQTAAVVDFRPTRVARQKIKRGQGRVAIELEPTPDLLQEITAGNGNRLVVGFAAETENLLDNARAKLQAKQLDMVVANDVTREGAGFDSETNIVTILTRDGRQIDVPRMPKFSVANRVLDEVVRLKGAGR